MVVAYAEHYTVRDHAAWEGDWELIHGAPYAMSPSPGVTHQSVSGAILNQMLDALRDCAQCHALMGMDWDVSDDTVVRPDVMVICHELDERVTRTPEIIFEVISPRTAERDERTKFELYQKEGVEWYVLVYPEHKTAKVYQRVQGQLQKAGDFSGERFTFTVKNCALDIVFGEIWRRKG